MELRTYWEIVWRRWWLVAIIVVLVGAASVALQPQTRDTYAASVDLEAQPRLEPFRGGYAPNQDPYYGTLNMELFWDDINSKVVKTGAFAEKVRQELQPQLGGRTISGSFDAKKEHRGNTITVTADSPEAAQQLANTAARLLIDPNGPYQSLTSARVASITIVNPAGPGALSSRVGGTLNLGLRLLLGVIAGVALAFLLEYLDDSVRTPREAQETLGLPVMGEIPPLR